MRILVVDDNYVNRVQLKTLLSHYGDCDGAASAKTAFEMFKESHQEGMPYTLITMDIELGDQDGRSVVEQIRKWEDDNQVFEKSTEVKILMVTVKDSGKDVFSSFAKGCEGYLIKPVTPDKIKSELGKIGLG